MHLLGQESFQSVLDPVRLLITGQTERDTRTLRAIADQNGWNTFEMRNNVGALACITSRQIGVVLAEHDVVNGNWLSLLEQINELPRPPRFVVFSRWADERLWADVLNRGGFDLLSLPVNADELHHSVDIAWTSWQQGHGPTASRRKPAALQDENARHEIRDSS